MAPVVLTLATLAVATASVAAAAPVRLASRLAATPIASSEIPAGWRVTSIVAMSSFDVTDFSVRSESTMRSAIVAHVKKGSVSGTVVWFVAVSPAIASGLVTRIVAPANQPLTAVLVPGLADGWVLATGAAVADIGAVFIEVIPNTKHPADSDPADAAALLRFGAKHLRRVERSTAA